MTHTPETNDIVKLTFDDPKSPITGTVTEVDPDPTPHGVSMLFIITTPSSDHDILYAEDNDNWAAVSLHEANTTLGENADWEPVN